MTQEVIVYRNPLEQAFWNSIISNPEILLSFMAAFIVFVVIASIFDKFRPKLRQKKMSYHQIQSLQLWVSTICGIVTLFVLLKVL